MLIAATKQDSKILRSLAVLKWWLSTLRGQFGKRDGKRKKPLNPCLGELFIGHWDEEQSGKTEVVVEQISHHPPASAFRIWNEKHKVRIEG